MTRDFALSPGVVHLREGSLLAPADEVEELRSLLSPEETARADRLRHDHHRNRLIVSHGRLRQTLAPVVGVPPAALRFEYGRYGKPDLPEGPAFSMSHSADRFVLAVAPGGRLGVDVEIERPVPRMARLVEAKFSPDEVRRFREASPEDRQATFFRIWTLKEAYLKALGTGLATCLYSFTVDPRPGATHALASVNEGSESPADWLLRGVPGHPGTSVAVAIDQPDATIVLGMP